MKMENVFLILINLLISAAVYLGIALLFILTGKRKKSKNDKNGLTFNELFFDYANLPQLKMFAARDGKQLVYRHYTAQSDAYMLLSPFLKYNAPTMRANSGGWAHVHFWRIAGLTMLNNVGIHGLDYLTTLEFNMPEEARDGTETLAYSHRLNAAYAPRNYKKDLRAITQPLLVVVGSDDEAFIADQFGPVISQYTSVRVELLPGVSHMGVVVRPEVRPVVKNWLKSLGCPQ